MVFDYMDHDLTGLMDRINHKLPVPEVPLLASFDPRFPVISSCNNNCTAPQHAMYGVGCMVTLGSHTQSRMEAMRVSSDLRTGLASCPLSGTARVGPLLA